MKLVYLILAVTVAANAEPIAPMTQSALEKLAKNILESVESAQESIDKFVAETEEIVRKKLLTNELVKKVQSTLNEKIETQSVSADCSVSVEKQFSKLVALVNDDLLHKLTYDRFGKDPEYINTLKNELSQLKDVLENHVDEEIKSCLDVKSKCKLTGEFLEKSEEYFLFADIMRPIFPLMVQSSDEYFDSPETGNKIVVNFTHPIYENPCFSSEQH